jgi:flagellar hook assembly protein FlgD
MNVKLFKLFLFFLAIFFISFNASAKDMRPPIIKDVKFDEKTYFPSDIISSTPRITATVTDEEGSVVTIEVWFSSKLVYSSFPGPAYDRGKGVFDYTLSSRQKLDPGKYEARLKVVDDSGNEVVESFQNLKVVVGVPRLIGPACDPLDFSPRRCESASITYDLSFGAPLRVLIYNSSGDLIRSWEIKSGSEGGGRGLNRISWDGTDDTGRIVRNGPYNLRIISGNRVLGTAKFIISD